MTVELTQKLSGTIHAGDCTRSLKGCYIGDLLSLAMSRVEADNIWITIQSNINIIAVASLTDAGCIVVCDGFLPDADAIEKAKSEDIALISVPVSAYEAASIIHDAEKGE